ALHRRADDAIDRTAAGTPRARDRHGIRLSGGGARRDRRARAYDRDRPRAGRTRCGTAADARIRQRGRPDRRRLSRLARSRALRRDRSYRGTGAAAATADRPARPRRPPGRAGRTERRGPEPAPGAQGNGRAHRRAQAVAGALRAAHARTLSAHAKPAWQSAAKPAWLPTQRNLRDYPAPMKNADPVIPNRRYLESWLRGQDLNLRPSGYEPDELPDCSTPRLESMIIAKEGLRPQIARCGAHERTARAVSDR